MKEVNKLTNERSIGVDVPIQFFGHLTHYKSLPRSRENTEGAVSLNGEPQPLPKLSRFARVSIRRRLISVTIAVEYQGLPFLKVENSTAIWTLIYL